MADSNKDDQTEDDVTEEIQIHWTNIIFLPFNPVFKVLVLISVIVKSFLIAKMLVMLQGLTEPIANSTVAITYIVADKGPIQGVYSIVFCSDVMDRNVFVHFIKVFYWYFSDVIYGLDTLIHIVHRQVIDKAMKREFLPKSIFLLFIDIVSLIPFYSLARYEDCPPVELWPNLLAFLEFIVIYRVVDHFSLITTHSYWKLFTGFLILLILSMNFISCILILLTEHGLCENCRSGIYDWRKYIPYQINVNKDRLLTHIYSAFYVMSLYFCQNFTVMRPATILGYFLTCIYLVCIKILIIFAILPKLFSDSTLEQRNIFVYFAHAKKIISETKRRNPSKHAHVHVTDFYNLMWKNRNGIINIPNVICELPRSLRVDLRQDLVWPLFYHSPTLRKTSIPFQRWLCEFVHLNYKLPGEKFYTGPHCFSNMYYLKSGIVQLISADDGVTPLLSVTSGTIFGDISFIVPPPKNITVRCLTYCEVMTLSRFDILKAMQRHPLDCRNIKDLAKGKIKHARTLYTCKQLVRGLDRTEDEGIVWIKRRWWEISDALAVWKKTAETDRVKCVLPPEETVYHCSKYIGQMVLCSELQPLKRSTFANVKFPWLLSSESSFIRVWHIIVVLTVFIVLLSFPPMITKQELPNWFKFILFWTDFVYVTDICISLLISTGKDNVSEKFSTVLFTRCKRLKFVLDLIASIWFESIALLVGYPELYNICRINRLLKIYVLFTSEYVNEWNIKMDPIFNVLYHVALTHLCWHYLHWYIYYIVEGYDIKNNVAANLLHVMDGLLYNKQLTLQMINFALEAIQSFVMFIIHFLIYAHLIASLYLKESNVTNFQRLVTNLNTYFECQGIHRDLKTRLNNFLMHQWKYFRGMEITNPLTLKEEPFDVFWKVQGEVAEGIISKSKAFIGADVNFVRELASKVKFFMMHKFAAVLLFGVESRNVCWIVQGHIKCEYHNDDGNLITTILDTGEMISLETVLLRRPSLKTYTCHTDCELMYININEFFNVIKRYPNEWSHLRNCIGRFHPFFDSMIKTSIERYQEYQKRLRVKIFHARHRDEEVSVDLNASWRWPDSDFMFYWMLFRALSVVVSIFSAALQGGSGVLIKRPLIIIGLVCDCIAVIDVLLKMFVAYYNKKGILVLAKRKCFMNYLTRSFLADVVGILPLPKILGLILMKEITHTNAIIINTAAKFLHLYIVTSFFNHIADSPTIFNIYLLILKWQVVPILVMVGASPILMSYCVDFTLDNNGSVTKMTYRNECWITNFNFDGKLTNEQMHTAFAECLSFMQNILFYRSFNIVMNFRISKLSLIKNIIVQIARLVFMYIMCYVQMMLILTRRDSTINQHGVRQLKKFLKAEGVDSSVISNVESHFSYWWKRTRGIKPYRMIADRISLTLQQDLFYYFFKETLMALDTLLQSGEAVQTQLSYMNFQICFRHDQQIVREMDLVQNVLIVHRGKVTISKEGKQLAVLGKGSVFGPLDSLRPRPVRISAKSTGLTDILYIPIKDFNEVIDDKVRANIVSNPESQNDYMAVRTEAEESPHRTIDYILRGRKTIQLPKMKEPVQAHKNWYSAFLYVVWFINPSLCLVLVNLFGYVPDNIDYDIILSLYFIDFIHLLYLVSEFWTIQVRISHNRLVKERRRYRLLLYWGFYVDLLSLIVPFVNKFHLARLLRLRLFYPFHKQFCTGFKSRVTPFLFNLMLIILGFHTMICGWISIACRDPKYPLFISVDRSYNDTKIDYSEWQRPDTRKEGCCIIDYTNGDVENATVYLVPRQWANDYIIALTFMILKFTHSGFLLVAPMNLLQTYYKLITKYLMYLLEQWIVSMAISVIYTMLSDMNHYDYNVNNLITYLRQSGLAPPLLKSVKEYTKQLWQRQRGKWLPELVYQAPMCLREDIFSSLYLHHLSHSPVFRDLPDFFNRQLVTRFKRIVVLPGKCIVEEGDIFASIFFIHEGDVEKWQTDQSGNKRAVGLLATNNFFGTIPSFCDSPYAFSYYTRTVVDLVYLRFSSFKDLMEVYPDVKEIILSNVNKLKREQAKGVYRHTTF